MVGETKVGVSEDEDEGMNGKARVGGIPQTVGHKIEREGYE